MDAQDKTAASTQFQLTLPIRGAIRRMAACAART